VVTILAFSTNDRVRVVVSFLDRETRPSLGGALVIAIQQRSSGKALAAAHEAVVVLPILDVCGRLFGTIGGIVVVVWGGSFTAAREDLVWDLVVGRPEHVQHRHHPPDVVDRPLHDVRPVRCPVRLTFNVAEIICDHELADRVAEDVEVREGDRENDPPHVVEGNTASSYLAFDWSKRFFVFRVREHGELVRWNVSDLLGDADSDDDEDQCNDRVEGVGHNEKIGFAKCLRFFSLFKFSFLFLFKSPNLDCDKHEESNSHNEFQESHDLFVGLEQRWCFAHEVVADQEENETLQEVGRRQHEVVQFMMRTLELLEEVSREDSEYENEAQDENPRLLFQPSLFLGYLVLLTMPEKEEAQDDNEDQTQGGDLHGTVAVDRRVAFTFASQLYEACGRTQELGPVWRTNARIGLLLAQAHQLIEGYFLHIDNLIIILICNNCIK